MIDREPENESAGIGKADVSQLQDCEAQARGAGDLQRSAS